MADVLSFDEINYLRSYNAMFAQAETEIRKTWYAYIGKAELKERLYDTLEDMLVYAFASGISDVDTQLSFDRAMRDSDSARILRESLDYKVAGKSTIERIGEHIEENSLPKMLVLVDTEVHRIYNTAMLEEAKALAASHDVAVMKTWHTMEDERVRQSHYWLDKVSVLLDDDFYTYDDFAPAPGMFDLAENNVNCRCWLTYSLH